jgi:RNA polymerase sigma-70 factor, ECF subfamily
MRITEDNFINQLKMKNEKALNYVLDQYGWIIKSTVKKHLYNLQTSQDECINDILMALWYNIDSFDETRGHFKNWLAGVAKFKCLDYKRKYLKDFFYENIDDLDISVEDTVNDEIIKNDLDEELEDMLGCLKDDDKDLFIKLYVEEKDINNISNQTGLKREVIYNRVSRGKRKIRSLFRLKESGV